MRLEDWREWPVERLAPLLARQRQRWEDELGWDATAIFSLVEQARTSGQLPGLVAVDEAGEPAGWSYASVQDGLLFIGALHGDRAEVVRLLLDAVLSTPESSYARGYRCFVYPDSPAVAAALTRKRFEIQPFLYLQRLLGATLTRETPGVRPWAANDLPETARLLARAYAGSSDGRCFAPGGRLDEWAAYLAQLVRTPACGTWSPEESFAASLEASAQRLDAVLVATRLSADTTHVAQIAVDPDFRGQGLAARLINLSAATARDRGARRQTLLVADSNTSARHVYARLGFHQVAYFLYAERSRMSRAASASLVPAGDPSTASA